MFYRETIAELTIAVENVVSLFIVEHAAALEKLR